MDIVHVANKVKVSVHKNCPTGDTAPLDTSGHPVCEFLIYLTVPKAGGDGMLLGVCETEEAAETITSALNTVFGLIHTHP